MKVKELIANLAEYSSEAKLTFATGDGDLEILSIYSGDLSLDNTVYREEKAKSDPDVCIDLGEVGG